MAPEVLASKKYTETADVYSFAIVCWELLERACPYEGMSQIQVTLYALRADLFCCDVLLSVTLMAYGTLVVIKKILPTLLVLPSCN